MPETAFMFTTYYFDAVCGPFGAWSVAEPPAEVGVLSRRERTCKRDGITLHRGAWRRPQTEP